MNKLDTIRQKIEADRQQEIQRAEELDRIEKQITALDDQIDNAINAGQTGTAEKLVADQIQLKAKREVMRRISAHKTAPDVYYNELLEINAEEVAQMQPKVDKATAELKKAHKAYQEKALALMRILNEAATFRFDCGVLAGIGFLFSNPRFDRFSSVVYDQPDMIFSDAERMELAQMDPSFYEMLEQIQTYGQYR